VQARALSQAYGCVRGGVRARPACVAESRSAVQGQPHGVLAPAAAGRRGASGGDDLRRRRRLARVVFPRGAVSLDRGVAALLVDGPGQGETRLFNRLYLTADVHEAYSAILTYLLADKRVGNRIGIWGNSMGGHFAASAASEDPRFAACCVNGGSPRPIEILDRYPRFIEKFRAMTGGADPLPVLRSLDLGERNRQLTCPLLVLHGAPDQVFLLENAKTLYEDAASKDKQMRVWDDGDHCIYNHAHEKHCLVADWFASRLR
jgi:dienelactone hydrolase